MKIGIQIFLMIVFCSCIKRATIQTDDNNSIKIIDILSASDSVIFNLSYLASDIKYIPLKTPIYIHFNSIFKIVSNSDKIYINAGNDLICFDNKGYFLYNLSHCEIKQKVSMNFIYDFDISSDDKTAVVLSSDRVLMFSNTGTKFVFQKSIILKRPWPSLIDLVPGTNNILLTVKPISGSEPSINLLINSDGDTLFYRSNFYNFKMPHRLADGIIHYKTGNYLCFKEPLSDTVFYVDKGANDFRRRLILDFKGKTYIHWSKREGAYINPELNEYSSLNRIFEVSGIIFYNYSSYYLNTPSPISNDPFTISRRIVYERFKNRKIEIALNSELKEDLCGGPDFKFVDVTDGKLYSSEYALTLKKYTESEYFAKATVLYPLKKEELKKLADSLTGNDNPVLIIVTPKVYNSITNAN